MIDDKDIMKQIIQLLSSGCNCESVVNYNCSKLWFDFRYGSMMMEVACDEGGEEKYSYKHIGDFDINEFINDVKIGRLYVTDPISCIEEPHTDYEMGWKMFQMVKFINSKYPEAIKDYYVNDFLMDPYIMEGENLWYSYFIEIEDGFKSDKHFISAVVEHLENHKPDVSVNKLLFQGLDITPRYDIRHLTTNTKVRRLGYFKLILALFKETPLMLDKPFLKKIGDVATSHEEELLNYKNSKGIIKQTKTGGGAKPYVDVALGLNLITKVGNGYELGKVSRAYNAIQLASTSPFELDLMDKAFFLESILRYDYLYVYTLLEYAYTAQEPSYKDAKGVYQQMLLGNLRKIKEGANRVDSIKKFSFQTVERRIREWKKPNVYLEHVLMPRLNWLYDLELLDLRDDLSFELTKKGERLFSAICGWRDISGVEVTDSSPYLDAFFMKVFEDVYGSRETVRAREDIDSYLTMYLEESFRMFKTFAPNRVTFSVFSNYAKWRLYQEIACAIDIDDIVRGFLKSNQDKYIFKFQKFYNDGYIQKIK